MSVRSTMTMRAVLQRDDAGKDPYGHKSPAMWRTIDSNLPCIVWESSNRKIYGPLIVEAGYPMMIVPYNTDVTIDDRFETVMDRLGTELYANLYIESVIKRRDHKELRLKKIA
jgi:hypothetical protein